jgi:hypothetical protein
MNRLIQFKSSRWAAILVATVVAIITSVVVANATQTVTTPNAAFITYNLNPGTSSAAITPAINRSVLVMGCCTNSTEGVGHVSLVHTPGFILWSGSDFATGPTRGSSLAAGTHIVYINGLQNVDIQTASADTILIHNAHTLTHAGNVTLIW